MLQSQVDGMLKEHADLSLRVITSDACGWLVHGENKEIAPEGRELVLEKEYDAFVAALTSRFAEGRSLKALHHANDTWAAYFEGEANGKVAFAIVTEGNDEMLAKLGEKCGDDELALRAMAFGDDVWLLYFEGELQGDCTWVLHSDFVEFSKLVNTQQEADAWMREVTYGNGVWVGYWEGACDHPWRLHARPVVCVWSWSRMIV
jgi:hypothetical protein